MSLTDRGIERRQGCGHWAASMARAGLALVLVSGCASSGDAAGPDANVVTVTATPAAASEIIPAAGQSLSDWLAGLRTEAQRLGVRKQTFDTAFAHVRLLDRILELDSSQPEFSRPVWTYLDSAVSDDRTQAGRAKLAAHKALLARVANEYHVPPEILIAFWGVESDFGVDVGEWSVIDALTTLAYKSRRPGFFRGELLAALRILESGDIPLAGMRGSWAGAMGQTQFIPTIFLKHAVDYDHDGRRDIWNSLPDVFASTAHFIVGIGWRPGESWGEEVKVPAGFPWDQAELTVVKPISEWRELGVRGVRGTPLADYGTASIIAPAGHSGPAFLVRENYRVIMRYNPSISYALAVALLADRMKGGGGIVASWPRHEAALSRAERVELQEKLAAIGLNPGSTDSLIGKATRGAIRLFQKTIGDIPDGFATKRLLERLRARADGRA